jgi:hypothetical protein
MITKMGSIRDEAGGEAYNPWTPETTGGLSTLLHERINTLSFRLWNGRYLQALSSGALSPLNVLGLRNIPVVVKSILTSRLRTMRGNK